MTSSDLPALTSTAPPGQNSVDLVHAIFRFLRVLQHRRWVVICCLLIAGLLGGVYYLTATRVYLAQSSLLVTSTGPDVWNTSMTPDAARESLIPTYERLFTSAAVLSGALQRLSSIGGEVLVDFHQAPREEWEEILRRRLGARALRRTNIIELSYVSTSPRAAEAVVNAVVESYLQFMDRTHRDVSTELVQLLDNERRQIEGELTSEQQKLMQVQRDVKVLGLKQGSHTVHPAVQRVLQLNEQLMKVREQRVQLETTLLSLQSAINRGGDLREHLVTLEPMVGRELLMSMLGLGPQYAEAVTSLERKLIEDRAHLDTLLKHYGPNHPQVRETTATIRHAEEYLVNYQQSAFQRLNDVQNRHLGPMLLSMLREKLTGAQAHESELARVYDETEKEAVELTDKLAELSIVERNLERLNKLHESMLDRMANIDMRQERADVQVSIVSDPVAFEKPVSPRLFFVAFFCMAAGFGGGALIVYVMDLLDDRFRSPEELREQLQVPLLAIIRKLSPLEGQGVEGLQVHATPDTVESEAFRTLRTTLAFGGEELNCVAVTSSEPGDGKTTVISNLAASFAQAGKRTLLIDADLRRPGLTKLFGLRRSTGLSDILRGPSPVAAMCQDRLVETGIDGLHLLPCGPKPSDPAVLLSSNRMSDVLAWAEGEYDQVLIDCPPVMAASDAAIVGRLTGGVMLVVQPQKNHRRLVIRATENLMAMQVKLAGVVANRVGNEKGYGYYDYGYGYGYGYGSGYGYGQDMDDDESDNGASTDQPAELDPNSSAPMTPRRRVA